MRRTNLTDNVMEEIALCMDDEIREQVYYELAPCTNEEFIDRYCELDPMFEEFLLNEFNYIPSYKTDIINRIKSFKRDVIINVNYAVIYIYDDITLLYNREIGVVCICYDNKNKHIKCYMKKYNFLEAKIGTILNTMNFIRNKGQEL